MMEFVAIKTKERLPNMNERVFFFDSQYEDGLMQEYNPNEKIEIKKGKFILVKDCEVARKYYTDNFDYWLELKK